MVTGMKPKRTMMMPEMMVQGMPPDEMGSQGMMPEMMGGKTPQKKKAFPMKKGQGMVAKNRKRGPADIEAGNFRV